MSGVHQDPYLYFHEATTNKDDELMLSLYGVDYSGKNGADVDATGAGADVTINVDVDVDVDVDAAGADATGADTDGTDVDDADPDHGKSLGDVNVENTAGGDSVDADAANDAEDVPPLEYDHADVRGGGLALLPEVPENPYSLLTWTFEAHADVTRKEPSAPQLDERTPKRKSGTPKRKSGKKNVPARHGIDRKTSKDDAFYAELAHCHALELERVLPTMLGSEAFDAYDYVLARVGLRKLKEVLKKHRISPEVARNMKRARRTAQNRLYKRASRERAHRRAGQDEYLTHNLPEFY